MVISLDLAKRLREAGLRWEPAPGDKFVLPDRGMDDEVFVLSNMTIDVHEFPTGRVIGFNGTVEWALDSVEQDAALWLPSEEQLRDRLGGTFVRLYRSGEQYDVTLKIAGSRVEIEGDDPAEAYGRALLYLADGEQKAWVSPSFSPVADEDGVKGDTVLFGDEHVQRYLETDGEEGYSWYRGTTILILTTTGRQTGKKRQHALIFREDAGRYLVVASNGGAASHPAWYLNLKQNPDVEVQVKGERFTARARDATPEERPRLWAMMAEVWPDYDNYQRKTSREIPIVVLERT